ncbi:hypothetical protein PR202_gb24321 [Eleusine coracana subsp. coracana]|uniref:Uncharacterized protein n=1 Tax=Eleusine coracana subsp. coracana TaxID=191504 RepID=A0AAV5FM98_ELECO|nr:hypothetical protein PR202_gb24321 [Eleusine coracana subsp. coracana]
MGSNNEDLRLQDEHSDDSDDDVVAAGGDELGASASTPVDVEASPTSSTAAGKNKVHTRARTSDVWKDMEELNKVVNGKET